MRRWRLAAIGMLFFGTLQAGTARPSIGLVLSGGGARGGAHVGVLKVLEAHRIPVDYIVGTSMGSLVGGLYASGYRSGEIERILEETDWAEYVAFDYDRTKIPFRRKELQHAFPGDLKIDIDSQGDFTLASGLFKRQPMLRFLEEKFRRVADVRDFNDLPIPYRAVATDFFDGESVALSHGSLARSVYASLAIPGGFYPIRIEGRTLVDGGVANNLPLDVMRRAFDPDIILVVDVSMPFEALPEHQSFLEIVNQLSNILVRKNTDRMLETLRPNETLVMPELKGVSWVDPNQYPLIIARGETAMRAMGLPEFEHLALDDQGYGAYRRRFEGYKEPNPPVIDRIVIENPTYLDERAIRERLHVRLGAPLNLKTLERDIDAIYHLTLFDDVAYRIERHGGETVLILSVTPAADIRGKLRFAFGFEDDFEDESDYSVRIEYLMSGLNRYGGEWRTRVEVGIQKLIYTELYQPLEPMQRFYIHPALFYRDKKINAAPRLIFGDGVQAELDQYVPLRAKERGAQLGVGVNLSNEVRVEGGALSKKAEPKASFVVVPLDANGSSPYFYSYRGEQMLTSVYGTLQVDTLDHAFFPDRGVYADLQYRAQLPQWGSEADYTQFEATVMGIVSIGPHALLGRVRYGTTAGGQKLLGAQDFNAYYSLGGLFNLSGLPANAVIGDTMAFGLLGYRYRLSDKGFFGTLEMATYLGATLETGDAWYSQAGDVMQRRNAASVYVAVDTVLGPFYLGYGASEGGYNRVYLSLGSTF